MFFLSWYLEDSSRDDNPPTGTCEGLKQTGMEPREHET